MFVVYGRISRKHFVVLQETQNPGIDQRRPANRWHLLPDVRYPGLHRDRLLRDDVRAAGQRLRHPPHEYVKRLSHKAQHPPLPHVCRQVRHWLLQETRLQQGHQTASHYFPS
jgi:hypothetical protein